MLVDNEFSSLYVWQSKHGKPVYAVHTSSTRSANLVGNWINELIAIDLQPWSGRSSAPASPFCSPPPGTVVAIASQGDAGLTAIANQITRLRGGGVDGMAIAVHVSATNQIALSKN